MNRLKIETGIDNPILHEKSTKVDKIDKKVKKLIKNMNKTLQKENGLGLAAPQVGVHKRIILCNLNYGTAGQTVIPLINPEIIYTSKETEFEEEGCLSIPGVFKPVERYKKIRVKFQDLKTNEHIFELEGLNARIVQHETDHLDGILFVDRIKEAKDKESLFIAF